MDPWYETWGKWAVRALLVFAAFCALMAALTGLGVV
jgi:hypothetical protein